MIYELLTIPVLSRLEVSMTIVSGTMVDEFDLVPYIYVLDWDCGTKQEASSSCRSDADTASAD